MPRLSGTVHLQVQPSPIANLKARCREEMTQCLATSLITLRSHCNVLTHIHHTTNDLLSFLKQLNKFSGILGHLISLVADHLLDLDALLHVGQSVWRAALVEAGRSVLDMALEGGLVVLADGFVQVQEGLSGCDALGKGGEGRVVDHGDDLGDGGGRHLGRVFDG